MVNFNFFTFCFSYIAILFPLKPRMTKFQAKCIITLIWCVALLTPLPTAILSRLVPKQQVLLNAIDVSNDNKSTVFSSNLEQFQSFPSKSKWPSIEKNTSMTFDFISSSTPIPPEKTSDYGESELYTCSEQWSNPNHRYLYSGKLQMN